VVKIPFGVDDALMAASLLGGLGGLFKRRGPDPREQYLDRMGAQLADQQNRLIGSDQRNVYNLAGIGGDAIGALGRRLGSSMAGAGVTNSSATAGALTQAQRDMAAQIASLGQQNLQNELQQQGQNQQWLTGARLGVAQNNVNYDRQNRQNSLGGMAQLLQMLGQRYGGGGTGGGSTGEPVFGGGAPGSSVPGSAQWYIDNPPGALSLGDEGGGVLGEISRRVGAGNAVPGANAGRMVGNAGYGMQGGVLNQQPIWGSNSWFPRPKAQSLLPTMPRGFNWQGGGGY
jgi:hypothetical protein